jgi:hypothetical protein
MLRIAGLMVLVTTAAALPGGAEVNVTSPDLPTKSADEIAALLARAKADGRMKTARKTRPVDARKAKPGEIVVSMIKGEGKETHSRPAVAGDWVVRNRCPETGNEEYLVGADKFPSKYTETGAPAASEGWKEFRPVGKDVRFVIVGPEAGAFRFKAPWGEWMVARPGDALVQDPKDEKDIYRVAKASFECTYEVVG